ncbi:hypothetical protein HDU76_001166, partial [Blyttiomyces sp. JEL0837]
MQKDTLHGVYMHEQEPMRRLTTMKKAGQWNPVIATEKESLMSRMAEVGWHRIECKGKFERSGYSGVSWFGEEHVQNPLSKLDLETMTWGTIMATGDLPYALDSHTAVVSGRKMYLYGGVPDPKIVPFPRDLTDHFYNLDLDTYEWRKLKYPNQPFAVLYSSAIIPFGRNQQSVPGGGRPASNRVHVFNFSSRTWSNPAVDDPLSPTPRNYHMAWVYRDY